ncbi:MAG: DUF4983 domain-containing protein [Flavobacteriales bacterium]|nr:MAG: DUF4983 domain-containing protein [Flavobacteriales bacterium]
MKNRIFKILLMTGALLSIIYTGCKKFDNPPPVFEELQQINTVQRKVLVISIDGVTGAELKTIAPPKLEELKKTGKYSYDVLRGAVANDAASWASMVTGTSYSKHAIQKDDFLPTPKENSHDVPTVYRNVLDYVLQYKAVKTSIITPWQNLRSYLKIADFAPIVTTDLAAKDSTINLINTQASLGAVIVNFREVQAAGLNGGYSASNATYKDAILKVDGYVGEITTALKARKTYANEDWLIIVTTNHGGSNDNPQPGFLIASQKDIKSGEVKKSGFNTIDFNNTSINATTEDPTGLYDAATKDFTVQMQVKFNSSQFYVGFLGKSTAAVSGQTGWFWFQDSGNAWNTSFGGTANGSGTGRTQIPGGIAFDGKWHTLTMTVKRVDATNRTVTTYTDGVQNATGNVHSKNIATLEKFAIGYEAFAGGTNLNFNAADLQYFNIALDATTIKNNIALKNITLHPNYTNLVGYWRMDEGGDAIFANRAPVGSSFNLNGPFAWRGLGTDVPASMDPDPNAGGKSIIVAPSSVTALTMYWMNIAILPDFGIDGNPFLNQFEVEFIK